MNFAVTVLVADGLRIPPFDVHPSGDRVLRNAGLTREVWVQWVLALTGRHDDATRLDLQPTSPDQWEKLENELEPLIKPAVVCPGPETLRSHIDDLWLGQRANLDQWKLKFSMDYGGTFWAKVFRFLSPHVVGMTFHLVTYRAPVLLPVSSTAALLSIGADEDARALALRVESAL